MSVPVLLEWDIHPKNGSPYITYRKRMQLAAAPREGDYVVHSAGWAAEAARSVMICEEEVFVRFRSEVPATYKDSELIGKLEQIGWERL